MIAVEELKRKIARDPKGDYSGEIDKLRQQAIIYEQNLLAAIYSDEKKRKNRVDRNNPKSPLSQIVGNDDAVEVIGWLLFDALSSPNRACNVNVALIGPPSTGKTMIARLFAESHHVPLIELAPKNHSNIEKIVDEIIKRLATETISSPPKGKVVLPAMDILLDEAHAFAPAVIEALKKATERNDLVLASKDYVFDCRNVCWILATDRIGELDDAFISRFKQIRLNLYSKDEIARIVKQKHPDFAAPVCQLISFYCSRIPREADNFAKLVKKAYKLNPGSWEDVVEKVARVEHIDKFGMTTQRLKILEALGQRPRSIDELCIVAQVKEEELKRMILPWLLESTSDQQSLVVTSNRHYITKEGLKELDKRGIKHRGNEILSTLEKD